MPTRRLRALERRIAELDAEFLPSLRPLGIYTPQEYDRVRAFVVLSHAEIESYLESVTTEIVDNAEKRWKTSGRAGKCLAALMMYGHKQLDPPGSLNSQDARVTFEAYFLYLAKRHREFLVKDNHGIKEKNILRMLLPIGVLEGDLDPVWLASMNSFGIQRGNVAHKSAAALQNPPDPQTMRNTVDTAIDGLRDLEPKLNSLKLR